MREKYTVEQVQDAIRRDPDITGKARDSLDAIIDGGIIQNDFKGRIHTYKCQGNYVRGLSFSLTVAVDQEVITDPEVVEEIIGFQRSDLEFSLGDPGNSDRLARINGILDRVIRYLEGEVGGEEDE